MYHANPIQGERFFLRLLLTVRRSPQFFDDLNTVNEIEHPTFQAAIYALGLLEDGQEWIDYFDDAIVWARGRALWYLCDTALVHGGISNPIDIWIQFQVHFCDDLE